MCFCRYDDTEKAEVHHYTCTLRLAFNKWSQVSHIRTGLNPYYSPALPGLGAVLIQHVCVHDFCWATGGNGCFINQYKGGLVNKNCLIIVYYTELNTYLHIYYMRIVHTWYRHCLRVSECSIMVI